MKKIRILPISIIVALFSAFAAQAQWVKVSVPIVSGDPILALAESGGYLFAGTGQSGIFRSANNGANWTAVNNGYSTTGAVCQLVPGATSLYVTTFVSGNCFITTNNGINWTQLNPPEALGFAVIGKCLIAEGTYGIYRSADSGNTWTYNYGFELSHGYPVVVFGHYLFAGNNPGYVRSADSGATWTAPDSNSFPTGFASGVYAFASLGKYIFAGTYGPGIYRSADSGITWNAVNTGLPPDSIGLEVQALVACRGSLFAGVNVEVNTIYQTSDSGKAWKDVGTGYPEGKAAIWALAECGGYLFAGTSTNVWRRPLSDFGIAVLPEGPKVQSLVPTVKAEYSHENVAVHFSVESVCNISIEIFNITGKKIASIKRNIQKAGDCTINFNTGKIASGLYFCRFKAGKTLCNSSFMVARE